MKILAVDDDEIFLSLLQSILEHAGYDDVTCVSSATHALELANDPAHEFECFLLDLVMPDVDGIELCRQLRDITRYRSTPIIMVTAKQEKSLVKRSFDAGATDFLNKPLDGLELGARIHVAGLLNESLKYNDPMADLFASVLDTSDGKLDAYRESWPSLQSVPGLVNSHSLENQILRYPSGCLMLNLFGCEIRRVEKAAKKKSPQEFNELIGDVAHAISDALGDLVFSFSHVGAGRFVCLVRGTRFLPAGKIIGSLANSVAESDSSPARKHGVTIDVSRLQQRRIWTAASAADAIRDYRDTKPSMQGADAALDPVEEARLFAELESLGLSEQTSCT